MGLFDAQVARKPDNYPEARNFIDTMWHGFWTSNEFNFESDKLDYYEKLTKEEQGVVVRTLSAIGQIEIAVKTFWANLGNNLPHPSITDLGFVMANSEVIHNLAYEKLLTVLGLEDVFEENLKEGVVADRVVYLKKYTDQIYKSKRKQYIYSICLFTIFVEDCSLFSQFYIMMSLNRYRNVLKDTAQQIQYTRNEEQLHAEVGIYLINKLREEYPDLFDEELQHRIEKETADAYRAESKVIDWILGGHEGENLSAPILKAYIKNRMSASLQRIGFNGLPKKDGEDELLEHTVWMDEESLGRTQTDFFHKRPVEYARSNKSFDVDSMF